MVLMFQWVWGAIVQCGVFSRVENGLHFYLFPHILNVVITPSKVLQDL